MWKCVSFEFKSEMKDTHRLTFLRFHRMMTRPYFSRDRISHFELFDRHTGKT